MTKLRETLYQICTRGYLTTSSPERQSDRLNMVLI